MTGREAFTDLLKRLGVGEGDVVYLHTSLSRLRHLGLSPDELLDTLLAVLGDDGTLVLPSFAWNLVPEARPWKGYAAYFEQRPVFDVRSTPANIGALPELFRRRPGVRRSLDYWWSVCALGLHAETVTAGQEQVTHPYGPGSSFDELRLRGAKIVGLGVTLNTTSLAPIVDYVLGDEHPQRVFTSEPQEGRVVDAGGAELVTRAYWLLPEIVRTIKPSVVFERSAGLHGALRRIDHGETIQFAYPFAAYFDEAVGQGRDAASRGDRVPWLGDAP